MQIWWAPPGSQYFRSLESNQFLNLPRWHMLCSCHGWNATLAWEKEMPPIVHMSQSAPYPREDLLCSRYREY